VLSASVRAPRLLKNASAEMGVRIMIAFAFIARGVIRGSREDSGSLFSYVVQMNSVCIGEEG
jgi:hypothetical protein